jgi:hypothetical protein
LNRRGCLRRHDMGQSRKHADCDDDVITLQQMSS